MSVLETGLRSGIMVAVVLLAEWLTITPLRADSAVSNDVESVAHHQHIEHWRTERHARLVAEDGYLTQVGLDWLKTGENRVGSSADNDIQLPGGPAFWGSVFLEDERLRFVRFADEQVSSAGDWVKEARLIADTEDEPTIVSHGTFSFYVIFRESFALRVKDTQAEARLSFTGIGRYPTDFDWLINGRFIRASNGETVEITNVLGQVSQSPVLGTFEFEKDGKTHSLLGIADEDSESVWFIFADRTSGHGSYGAGRFLYSDAMPLDGRLMVDFNKAYNPPCAFNAFSTCPLPPQRNRMDLKVTAGEKDFHADSG